jgi:pimeloyl-ACP methyl ester carboxylesterase
VKALKVPIEVIVGDRDPCKRMYVEPLLVIRPDIREQIIPGAGHIMCVLKPEFKADVEVAVTRNLATR